MKVTLPSTCATPTPSWSIDSMSASLTPSLALRLRRREDLALDLLHDLDAVERVGERRRVAVLERERRRADLRRRGRDPGARVEDRAGGAIESTRVRARADHLVARRHHQPDALALRVVGEERGEDGVALVRQVHAPAGFGGVPPQVGEVVREAAIEGRPGAARRHAELLAREA